jgi:hypothetical protein
VWIDPPVRTKSFSGAAKRSPERVNRSSSVTKRFAEREKRISRPGEADRCVRGTLHTHHRNAPQRCEVVFSEVRSRSAAAGNDVSRAENRSVTTGGTDRTNGRFDLLVQKTGSRERGSDPSGPRSNSHGRGTDPSGPPKSVDRRTSLSRRVPSGALSRDPCNVGPIPSLLCPRLGCWLLSRASSGPRGRAGFGRCPRSDAGRGREGCRPRRRRV